MTKAAITALKHMDKSLTTGLQKTPIDEKKWRSLKTIMDKQQQWSELILQVPTDRQRLTQYLDDDKNTAYTEVFKAIMELLGIVSIYTGVTVYLVHDPQQFYDSMLLKLCRNLPNTLQPDEITWLLEKIAAAKTRNLPPPLMDFFPKELDNDPFGKNSLQQELRLQIKAINDAASLNTTIAQLKQLRAIAGDNEELLAISETLNNELIESLAKKDNIVLTKSDAANSLKDHTVLPERAKATPRRCWWTPTALKVGALAGTAAVVVLLVKLLSSSTTASSPPSSLSSTATGAATSANTITPSASPWETFIKASPRAHT